MVSSGLSRPDIIDARAAAQRLRNTDLEYTMVCVDVLFVVVVLLFEKQ